MTAVQTLIARILLGCVGLFIFTFSRAQQPGATADTSSKKQIQIIQALRLNFKKDSDSSELQSLGGNVIVRQEKTLFYCDSALINKKTNILEAFGHVHINDDDSVQTYSDYLKYLGKEKKAYLKNNVKLTQGNGVLTTNELEYDLNTKIGIYSNGGKLVNDKTVLNSVEGYYYGETRDVYFKKKVVLVNPEYTIKTDTLLYNTATKVSTFIVPTEIVSGRQKIITSDGYYDLLNKKSYFGKRPLIIDSTTSIQADEIANDDSTGFGEARGNVVYKDSAAGTVLISNNLKTNKKSGSYLATQNPVMIIRQDQDSIFIAADTLFSGRLSERFKAADTIQPTTATPEITVKNKRKSRGPLIGPAAKQTTQNNSVINKEATTETDSSELASKIVAEPDDSTLTNNSPAAKEAIKADSSELPKAFTASKTIIKADSTKDRYIEAYYHVRIFSDSMQAVCDSMFYSLTDSTFRLFKSPVVWAQENQITGDTMYLYTQNQKPKRLYVFENALAINKAGYNYYNQIKGRIINGYFKNGNIENLRAKGNAESVYYGVDESKKFIGVNKSSSDIIDIYFLEKKLQRIVSRSGLKGTFYPMKQVNHDEIKLRGFKLQDEKRPKNKYELFGK